MRTLLLAAVGFAALIGASGPAMAQDSGGPPGGPEGPGWRFSQADANHDGVVTRAEFDAARTAGFTRLDANHDGQLARDEIRAGWRGAHRGGHGWRGRHRDRMARADANHDGAITRDEFLAGPTRLFDRLDANHDGAISADERQAVRERFQERISERRAERPNPDANGDGVISRAEFNAAGASMFERADVNHDGRVTRDEAEAARRRFLGG
jgi:Ca2+-binding EF-hand superfamily protein